MRPLLWLAGGLCAALVAAFVTYVWSEKQIDRANDQRHVSFLLADELRQSSDDLTRMVRTYTVTADPRYKEAYQAIVDIRDGKRPRPPDYANVYWDTALVDGPVPSAATGETVALLVLMQRAGFAKAELAKLAQAKANSDQLITTERQAIQWVDSGDPQAQATARLLVHDSHYHAAKAAIMQPIQEAYALMDLRTRTEVSAAEQRAMFLRLISIALAIGLMLVVLRAIKHLDDTLGESVDVVFDHIEKMGQGDFSASINVPGQRSNSVLGWLAKTQASLRQMKLERERERALLLESEARLSSIVEAEPECVKLISAQGHLLHMNPAGLNMFEADSLAQVTSTPLQALIAPEHRNAYQAMHQQVLSGNTAQLAYEGIGLKGTRRWLETHAVPLQYQGQTVHLAVTRDITARKAADDQIEKLAFFDSLTGLPNRQLLMDRLKQTLVGMKRKHTQGALLILDLDNFKMLNDTQGHLVGDQLLTEAAVRLRASIREGDTVARFGGDEFVIILENLEYSGMAALQAETVAYKILDRLSAPYTLEVTLPNNTTVQRSHHCTASLGIALFTDDSLSINELLKRADTAMYQAKAAGRNAMRFFDAHIQAQVSAHATLETDLREAVLKQQFVLYYQPQVAGDSHFTGVEALVRWQHPLRGLVSPLTFIPLAEENGLILNIGQWVLETACTQLAAWAEDPSMAHLSMAVNVSASQFKEANFVGKVVNTLTRTQARPQQLKLELTESMLIDDLESVIAKMTELKGLGVGFSLDDFGTGYSSLSHLKRLPLDQLKIDQSFVRNIVTDPNDAAIARMVLALADSLGLAVIAEGVERTDQADFLKGLGCHAYQGFLFGRPVPAPELHAWVSARRPTNGIISA